MVFYEFKWWNILFYLEGFSTFFSCPFWWRGNKVFSRYAADYGLRLELLFGGLGCFEGIIIDWLLENSMASVFYEFKWWRSIIFYLKSRSSLLSCPIWCWGSIRIHWNHILWMKLLFGKRCIKYIISWLLENSISSILDIFKWLRSITFYLKSWSMLLSRPF